MNQKITIYIILAVMLIAFSSLLVFCGGSDTTTEEDAETSTSLLRAFDFTLPLFTSTSGWNQTATAATVLATSDAQILYTFRVLLGDVSDMSTGTTSPQWPYPDVSYDDYSVAIYQASTSTQNVTLTTYEGDEGSAGSAVTTVDDNTATVPTTTSSIRPPGPATTDGDGHIVIYNTTENDSYDFWQATTSVNDSGNSLGGAQTATSLINVGAVEYFDVSGSGMNTDGVSSARASGVPLLAGMILPEDVVAGTIAHALGVSIPGPRNTAADPTSPSTADYFNPCSTTETDFYSTNTSALASGQRIRLKSTIVDSDGNLIDETGLAPITTMFLTALRNYGAYVVDNASGFSFYAEDYHTANPDLTDDQVNTLIGAASGTALESGKVDWQILMEKLNLDLEDIPFAFGPDMEGTSPSTATITTANYEVVEAAAEE